MSAMLGDLIGGAFWSKITPFFIWIIGILVLFCGYQFISIRYYKAEIEKLTMIEEQCRSNLKGAEDAAFNSNRQYSILVEYMKELGKNVIDINGEINEDEFKALIGKIQGKEEVKKKR